MADDDEFAVGDRTRRLSSVQRALHLLRSFVHRENGLSVTEAARELEISKSVVSRLMATLAADGFLVMDQSTRRYYIGPVAFEIGNRFAGADLGRALHPIIRLLSERTNTTAQLGTLQGQYVRYLSVSEGSGRLRVVATPGDKRYAHASAMGKAFLADLRPDEQRVLVESMLEEGKLPGSGPATIRDPLSLLRELEITHSRGYSTTFEEAEAVVAALGMVAPSVHGFPLAVSIAFPANQYTETDHPRLVQELRIAVQSIRANFAGPSATPTA
jgi:DNA-binding IclR family transcriptional regulator